MNNLLELCEVQNLYTYMVKQVEDSEFDVELYHHIGTGEDIRLAQAKLSENLSILKSLMCMLKEDVYV